MSKNPIKSLDPISAHKFLNQYNNAVLVDVRCEIEYEYIGHPVDAINIVWKKYPGWKINETFAAEVDFAVSNLRKSAKKTPILLICRSGARSRDAAKCLSENHYEELYNVEEGFEGDKNSEGRRSSSNGWRFHGLPWIQD
ncbi:MAG: rhodanese-like domain-containing protein [Gammaproteobacteria bacterium]|jgi:rhodanese-related sulfurtransferase